MNTDDTFGSTMKSPATWTSVTIVAVLLFFLFATIRFPQVELPCLNPDEAQYLAFASYLGQTDQSAFERPILHTYTHWIYHQAALLKGYYELKPVRIVTTAICGFLLLGIFLGATRSSGLLPAFIGGVFFLYEACYVEGFSSNREWFSLAATMVGWCLYFATPPIRHRYWLLPLSGFAIGAACWFKEQFAIMAAAVALDILYRGCARRDLQRAFGEFGLFLLGGVLAAMGFAAPMIANGTFHEQWSWLTRIQTDYAGFGESTQGFNGSEFFAHLYAHLPYRLLILAAFCGWGFAVVRMILSVVQGSEHRHVPKVISVSVFYLPLAIFAFQLGQRYFLHYYLFLLPPLAILLAYFIGVALSTRPGEWAKIALLTVFVMALCLDLTMLPSEFPGQTFASTDSMASLRVPGAILAIVVAALGLATAASYPPAKLWTGFMQALALIPIAIATVVLVVVTNWAPERAMMRGFSWANVDRLSDHLHQQAEPGDALLVWGWRPEIYVQSQIPAATAFVTSVDLLESVTHRLETGQSFYAPYADDLIRDLEMTKPRWIVDAWLISIYGGTLRLDYYPPLINYLARYYKRGETVDGCVIYERLPEPRATPEGVSAPIEEHIKELDQLLAKDPDAPMLRLTKGDILAQEGNFAEANAVYESLARDYPDWPIPKSRQSELTRLANESSSP